MKFIIGILFILLTNSSNAIAETPGFIHTDMDPGLITLFIIMGLILLVVGFITDATIDGTPIWLAGTVPFGFGIFNSILLENPFNEGFFSSFAVKAAMIVLAAILAKMIKTLCKTSCIMSVFNFQN